MLIDDNLIEFDNGNRISTVGDDDGYGEVYTYADFKQIEDEIKDIDFPESINFETCGDYGFRFGFGNFMIFVPCYSVQNGFYSCNLDVVYKNEIVLSQVIALEK